MRIRVNLTFLALICSLPLFSQSRSAASPPALQPYGRCPAPAQQGVSVCMPYDGAAVQSPFQVIGAGTSGRGQVALMELWADGKKLTQSLGTPFDHPVSLAPGDHELTLIEVDETGYYAKSTPFKVSVIESNAEPPCSPPDTPGVNVCVPAPNSCNTQSFISISAAAKGTSGPVIRMEVWINGAKVANFPGDHFESNMILFDFKYYMEIWEIDSHSNALKKTLLLYGPC
ncbi:MAG: hypothetical protein JOZ83_17910 [Silvibacterium sp.]|nr:hypothetical protein [Silvibacterium sp.]